MPKLSPAKQGERRARILDAAEVCFPRTGFHRTTMQDICREAGISAGALYLYFASKEELIAGIVDRDREDVLLSFAALAHEPNFLTGLQNVLRHCIIERPPHKAALFIEIGAEATRNPAVALTLAHCDQTIRASLLSLLERATLAGRIAPLRPLAEIVPVMELLADGMFWRRALDPQFDGEAVMPMMLAMVAPLLGAREPTPAVPATAQPAAVPLHA